MGVFDKLKAIVNPKDKKKKEEEDERKRRMLLETSNNVDGGHRGNSGTPQRGNQQQSSNKKGSNNIVPAPSGVNNPNTVTIPEHLKGTQLLLSATTSAAGGGSLREDLTSNEIGRDDFEPLAILGKGTFANVILVRATGRLAEAYRLATAATELEKQRSKARIAALSTNTTNPTSDRAFWPPAYDGEDPIFAMKIVPKKKLLDLRRVNDVFVERNVLAKSGEANPFVIKLRHTFQSEHKLFFVMDYMAGGDMRALINEYKRRREPMAYATVKLYATEIALALVNLHKNGILYRDLKPENILLDGDGHCYLADFGLSKDFGIWGTNADGSVNNNTNNNNPNTSPNGHLSVPGAHSNSGGHHHGGGNMRASSFVGSPMYVAPEVLLRKETYSTPVDFWGFGVILYTMLYGAEPFRGLNVKAIFDQILTQNVAFPPAKFPTPPEIIDLIAKLLIKDPARRLNGSNLFTHPFFHDVDINAVKRKMIKPVGFILKPPPCAIAGNAASGTTPPLGAPPTANAASSHHANKPAPLPAIPPNGALDVTHSGDNGYNDMYTPEHLHSGFRASQQKLFQDFGWCAIDDLIAQQEAAAAAAQAAHQQQHGGAHGHDNPLHNDNDDATSNYSHYSHSFVDDDASMCSEGGYDFNDGDSYQGSNMGGSSCPPSPSHDTLALSGHGSARQHHYNYNNNYNGGGGGQLSSSSNNNNLLSVGSSGNHVPPQRQNTSAPTTPPKPIAPAATGVATNAATATGAIPMEAAMNAMNTPSSPSSPLGGGGIAIVGPSRVRSDLKRAKPINPSSSASAVANGGVSGGDISSASEVMGTSASTLPPPLPAAMSNSSNDDGAVAVAATAAIGGGSSGIGSEDINASAVSAMTVEGAAMGPSSVSSSAASSPTLGGNTTNNNARRHVDPSIAVDGCVDGVSAVAIAADDEPEVIIGDDTM